MTRRRTIGLGIASLLVAVALAGGSSPALAQPPALYDFEYGPTNCTQWEGISCSLGIALQITQNPCGFICSGGDADGVNCGFTSGASADTDNNHNCSFNCLCGGVFWGWARAQASVSAGPPGGGSEISMSSTIFSAPGSPGCPAFATILASGQVPVWSYHCVDPALAAPTQWEGTVTAAVPNPDGSLGLTGGIARRGCIFSNQGQGGNSGALYVRWNDSFTGGVGLSNSAGTWSGSATVTGMPDDVDLSMQDFLFDDGWMDVTGDGRFNQADVDALPTVDPQDPANLQLWDFDRNGTLDADDVAFMQSLVTAGVDSGFFGDLDGDMVVCLADAIAFEDLLSGGSVILTDPAYRFEADLDLNGIINFADHSAFITLFIATTDCNCNGIDDSVDIAMGTSPDANGNGVPDECDCAIGSESVYVLHGNGTPGETRPNSGYIDPRNESTDCQNLNVGLDRVTFVFNTPVQGLGGTNLTASSFRMVETGSASPPNAIAINTQDNITVEVILDRPITLQEWTTVIAEVEGIMCGTPIQNLGDLGPFEFEPDRIDIGFLPGDVNQDERVSPLDLARWQQLYFGLIQPPYGILEDFVDTNRNGSVTPIDLLRFRQILLGTCPATRVWQGETMNNSQP